MKIKIYIVLIILISVIYSCNKENNEKSRYINTYYEILLTRESNPDTAIANPMVRQIIKKYGYSEDEFRSVSMKLYNDDPKGFTQIIDSIRKRAEIEMKKSEIKEKTIKDKLFQDSTAASKAKKDSLKADSVKTGKIKHNTKLKK